MHPMCSIPDIEAHMYCMVHGGKTKCAMSIHTPVFVSLVISLMFVENVNKATVCFLRNLFMLW